MDKRISGKRKITKGLYITAYGSLLYITFLLLYLSYENIIPQEYQLQKVVRNVYFAFLGIYSVKYFFETIFFNTGLIQMEFLPVHFKKILLGCMVKYSICTGAILSIYYLDEILLYREVISGIKTYFGSLLTCIVLTGCFLCLMFLVLLGKHIGKAGLFMAERILYLSLAVLYPLILNAVHENVILCCIGIPVFVGTEIFLFRISDRKYRDGLYYILCNGTTGSVAHNDYVLKKSELILRKLDAYCLLEVKRYMAIGKVLLSILIQYGITAVILLSFYGQSGRGSYYLFAVLNIVAANNFFATTAYSSDVGAEYEFYPLHKRHYFVMKGILAAVLQSCLFTTVYFVVLLIFKDDILFNKGLLYVLLLTLTLIYSFLGCLLDIVFRKRIEQMSNLIYGNIPKLILVIGSLVISGLLMNLCGGYLLL